MQEPVKSKRDNFIGYKKLDKALSLWAKKMKMSDALITASIAKQRAEELSSAMGHDLKPSTAWLYKWKDRENIKFAKRTKDPQEIVKELLDRKENELKTINEEKYKEQQLVMETTVSNSLNNGMLMRGNSLNQNHQCNEKEQKQRTKREYIKRLPIIGASGLICRSRKEKTFLTLLQKLEILQRLKNGERRPELIIEYNLSHSAMSQIITDEKKILELAAGGQNLQMKRLRVGIFKDGEVELNAWVREKMAKGETLTPTQIKNRAKEIAESLNIDFKASTADEKSGNDHVQFEQSHSSYDQQSSEMLENEIKEEQLNGNYCGEIESVDATHTEIKPMTAQEFYLQTLRADSQASQIGSETQTEMRRKEEEQLIKKEELDIKPVVNTPPTNESSILYQKVIHWLAQYNIDPEAGLQLLYILQPHIS